MNEVQRIRKILGKSQIELAKYLGVSQGTISRLEGGKVEISPDIFRRLTALLKESSPQRGQRGVDVEIQTTKSALAKHQYEEKYLSLGKTWNAYQVTSLNQAENSDLVLVKEIDKAAKAQFLIGDMTGHGKDSAYMAFAIKFAYESLLGFIGPGMISVELINAFIAQGIRLTKEHWKNNPSLVTGLVDLETNSIEFINNGMPHPLHVSQKNSSFYDKGRSPAIDITSDVMFFNKARLILASGESLVFFSDGLLDAIQEKNLLNYANEDLRYFRGDSRAIGKNILKLIKSRINDLRDDISFLVISLK